MVVGSSLISYFVDPVLRAPTIGSMLMCFAAGLIGVIVFLRKESLVGESLSHATYPGVVLGALVAALWGDDESLVISLGILVGSFLSACLGFWMVNFLQRRFRVKSDAALCFVLSAFFAVGITIASRMQFSHSTLYRQVQTYLYGQAATMTDVHIVIYGLLSLVVLLVVVLFYKELLVMTLDRDYARSLGIGVKWVDFLVFILVVMAVVIGIRSVGVVLMSAMLIAPAVAARQFSNKLSKVFIIAGVCGLISGFLGNYLSLEISMLLSRMYPGERVGVPTGPMIVVVASSLSVLALLFAPERGFLMRRLRANLFRNRCIRENLLKTMWKSGEGAVMEFSEIIQFQTGAKAYLKSMLHQLVRCGWVKKVEKKYMLTSDGFHRASHIVRLHRLWEVYLVEYLGIGAEKVHHSAEEMEHIITPELERELTKLLQDPSYDPHQQPIPREERL